MIIQNTQSEEKEYKFRGKKFMSSPAIIAQLNYALALNKSEERYTLVENKNGLKK